MKAFLRLTFCLTFLTVNLSCSKIKDSTGSVDLGSSGEYTEDTVLYLEVKTIWETDTSGSYPETWGTCSVSSTGSSSVTCNVSIPEARLYRSKVQFKVGTMASASCPILTFSPYYYTRSNSATYSPIGATSPTDCSSTIASERDKICWGGAAPHLEELGSDFPESTSMYTITAVNSSTTYNLKSENELRTYAGETVNYLVTNNLSNRSANTSTVFSRERSGEAFVDYAINCSDQWGEVIYSIDLTISDENIENGSTNDDYLDWL